MAKQRLLVQHFDHIRDLLNKHANHIGLGDHPDVLGLAREALVEHFFSTSLPSAVEYSTGEIVDEDDAKSGQIDIIIRSSQSPTLHLFKGINIVLADSVIATVEVKSNLSTANWDKSSHLKAALESITKTKQLKRNKKIEGVMSNGTMASLQSIPCLLIAFKGPTPETLEKKLVEYGKLNSLTKEEYWPDVIAVLDRGFYMTVNNGWLTTIPEQYPCSTNKKPAETLVGPFAYIVKLIEGFYANYSPTKFTKYLGIK